MFGGLKNLGDMGKIMAQAQEMQQKAADMQESLENITVDGSSGAGMVTATVTAKGKLTGLAIDPSLLKPEDAEVVQDLIIAAIAAAQEKGAVRAQEEMQKLMGDMPAGLQGMMGGS